MKNVSLDSSLSRYIYQTFYVAKAQGYLNKENEKVAQKFLDSFSLEDIRRMQVSDIFRSETQEIIVNLIKKVYKNVEEEVLIDRFYVVDILIPDLKIVIEV